MKAKRYMNLSSYKRIIISGGGTGGHVFPAISIANALRKTAPGTEILFVGAEGRMEMEKVPAAGYRIIGLPVLGFYRSLTLKNIKVIFSLMKSLRLAKRIIKEFKPDIAVGVGGYASGPVLRQAARMHIPTLIQEQNSYAGITNRLLSRQATVICVAYDGMEKYFPARKIVKTGNPVRQNFDNLEKLRNDALAYFGLQNSSPVILVLGGSLGAGTINTNLSGNIGKMIDSGCQWIWQTGRNYFESMIKILSRFPASNILANGFIDRMDYAFAAADVIISRAGAGTISELCLVGKPVILVPSPNVAEDHQMKNAMALSERDAAILLEDEKAAEVLVDEIIKLINDKQKRSVLSANIVKMAVRDSDIRIAQEVLRIAGK